MSGLNTQGYYLRKTGERVNELLSRQFIIPTIEEYPNTETLFWQDGDYEVAFRIGEFVRVFKENNYIFFRLNAIINNKASWERIDSFNTENYYTKEDVDNKNYLQEIPSEYVTEEELENRLETVSVDLSNYYTKSQIDSKLSDLVISGGGGGVEVISPEEYENKKENDAVISNMMYLLVVNGEPFELYIGTILIGKKGEIENLAFPYTFPIIF